VTISCVTAKEIVLKDFSAEVNENLIHRAAQLFVASLAGSIALVTCRQPLRAAFNQHIRHSLLAANRNLAEDQVPSFFNSSSLILTVCVCSV
jgi:CCR4-NOT transcription complex subunit 1